MSLEAQARIDLGALQHNYAIVKQHAPHANVLAMIKSRAYGHGLVEVATALSSAAALGVARLSEAVALREAGITKPLVVMSGLFEKNEVSEFEKHDLITVVHSEHQINLLKPTIKTWLKINSGMHRLGFAPQLANELFSRLRPQVIMTHLATADEAAAALFTQQQLDVFSRHVAPLNVPLSVANSAAILRYPATHHQWVRPGIMLYGVSPFMDQTATALNLKPVMTLTSRLIAIHELKRGDQIGYGGMYTCDKNMRVGVAAIGYGDGYPRHAKNGTPVLVNNKRCELVGRVSMDLITINLDNAPQADIGDEVTLWGSGLPVEEVALHSGTIAYELLCDVSSRVSFNYV